VLQGVEALDDPLGGSGVEELVPVPGGVEELVPVPGGVEHYMLRRCRSLNREVVSVLSVRHLVGCRGERRAESVLGDRSGVAVLGFKRSEPGARCDELRPAIGDLALEWSGGGHSAHDGALGLVDRIGGGPGRGERMLREFSAAGDGGDVGAVVGEDVLEGVAGGAEVGFVGDDEEPVALAASGGTDVEGAVAGAGGDEGVAAVDGVALVAVGGGGVAEAEVLACVVGGDGDSVVSSLLGQREGAVGGDGVDAPAFPVADGLAAGSAQGAVVAPGDDEVAGAGGLTAADGHGMVEVEVAEDSSVGVDRGVERVDVGVGLGCDGDGAVVLVVVDPGVSDAGGEVVGVAGVHSVVVEVGVEGAGVAGAQGEGGVGFPAVGEAVDVLEVVGSAGAAELVEHAAAPDGLELAWVADEDQSPLLGLGESNESVEGVGADHAGFVDNEGRPGRELMGGAGAVGPVPFVEELCDRVGRDPCLCFEDSGGLGGRGDPEHRAVLVSEVGAGATEGRGLAGAGRADQEDERVVARDGSCGVGLEGVEPGGVGGGRWGRGGDRGRRWPR
jgi:hypothetical protein